MIDVDAANDDPDLRDTPFGRISLVKPRSPGAATLVVIDNEETGARSVVGLLKDGATVLDGLYGKRQWEAWHVLDKAERQRIAEEQRQELVSVDIGRDFKKALDGMMMRTVDGRDALIGALNRRRLRT
jgi:hypothetical protein